MISSARLLPKTCSKCGVAKDISQFNRDRQTWSGIHPYCKACQAWYAAERYRRKKSQINRRNREWYRQNREKRLASMKEVRTGELFGFKNRIYAANRRAKVKSRSDGTATYTGAMAILGDQEWRCADCGVDLHTVEKHLDHVVPLCAGGLHSMANLQWLCRRCNLSKGGRVL